MKRIISFALIILALQAYSRDDHNFLFTTSLDEILITGDSIDYSPRYEETSKASVKSVAEDSPTDRLVIYPNPTGGTFRINTSPGDKFALITLYSTNGKQIWQQELESSQVPLVEYTLPEGRGFYLVEVKTSKRTIILTVSKK